MILQGYTLLEIKVFVVSYIFELRVLGFDPSFNDGIFIADTFLCTSLSHDNIGSFR